MGNDEEDIIREEKEKIMIKILPKLDSTYRREIRTFYNSLRRELKTFNPQPVQKASIVALAESTGQIIGLAGLLRGFSPSLFIVVKEDHQGMGIGNKLMEKTIKGAIRRKYSHIILIVMEQNLTGVKLFLKYGFRICGSRKGKYLMVLPLTRNNTFYFYLYKIILGVYRLVRNLCEGRYGG